MKERDKCLKHLQEKYGDIELIDNYHHNDAPENAGRLWHLGRSIQMMEEADAIFFVMGWSTARGCCVEYEVAVQYGLKILS
jgi:hypothetical protein